MISEFISPLADCSFFFSPLFSFFAFGLFYSTSSTLESFGSDQENHSNWEFSSSREILKSYRTEKAIKERKENKFLKLHSVTKGRKSRKRREIKTIKYLKLFFSSIKSLKWLNFKPERSSKFDFFPQTHINSKRIKYTEIK